MENTRTRNLTQVTEALKTLFLMVNENPDRDGLKNTPARFIKAFLEMTRGYDQDPAEILTTTFEQSFDEMIVLSNIPFQSMCEHHLLPFIGRATVGYIPNSKGVVGISKLARLVDCFAKRLQIQERLANEIANAIETHLHPQGVGVSITAEHLCMTCRGVMKPGTKMTTNVIRGIIKDRADARAEFMKFV